MRRAVFLVFAFLEATVAGVLINLGWQLPGAAEVEYSFDGAGRVTQRAGAQVRLLRQQVNSLRRPEVHSLATDLQAQTRMITATLQDQPLDFDKVRLMRDALDMVASSLDELAATLDPASLGKLGDGLREAAGFLEDKVVPGAERAAAQLDESTAALRTDALRLSALLREAPLDLQVAREVHDSLARFSSGLAHMQSALRLQRMDAVREGFRGLETSLNTGADQVERLSGYTYPVVKFNGARPEISQRQFWPEGDQIAEGMRKAAAGVTAAGKELEGMAAELPRLRVSLDEGRRVVDRTREALATALKQQDKVEPLLKDAPLRAARLAEQLPLLGEDLARLLRDTKRLKDIASALRQAQQGIEAAVARWPDLRVALTGSAQALKVTSDQFDQVLRHRNEYEAAMQKSVVLAEDFATLLPLLTNQLAVQLQDQEQALDDLGQSIDEVGSALPVYAQTTSRLLETGRLLAWLVAAVVGLHSLYLVLSVRMGRRYSF
jgi:hypothetical protein